MRPTPTVLREMWNARGCVLGALAIVFAVALAYAPVGRASFMWDDDLHVTANPTIVGPLGLREIWSTPAANYFPLAMTTFWLLHKLFGVQPLPYHLVKVALHATAAVLLWAVLRRLRVPGAWLGATWWALHPVQVETAAWISELKNTQSAVFFLAAIWCWLRWVEAGADSVSAVEAAWPAADSTAHPPSGLRRYYVLSLVCAMLALLSKSSTVMLPVVLALCSWWLRGRWRWRDAAALLPFFTGALIVSGWTIWEQKYSSGAQGAEWQHSLAERIAIAGRVPWFYLGKLIWPHPLIFIYPRWSIAVAHFTAWLPGLAAGAVGVGLVAGQAKSTVARAALFTSAVFVASLFPVLGFFDVYFFRFSFVGDHLQYLASMAPLALGAAAVARLPRIARVPLALGLVAAAGGLTWRQAHIYRNDLTLFSATVAENPGAWMAQNNLAAALTNAGRNPEAITHVQRALALHPSYVEAENNLGRALTEVGRPDEALAHLQRALLLDSRYVGAHNNLGIALIALGREDEGRASFAAALQVNSADVDACFNYGLAVGRQGNFAAAARWFEKTVALKPDHALAEMSLGLSLAALRRFDDACKHLDRAVQLEPRSAAVQAGYGRALILAGRLPEAVARYEDAVRLDPSAAEAHAVLGQLLRQLGRTAEAERQDAEAQRLRNQR